MSTDSKHWWEYVDNTVTLQLLDELTHEFLQILEKTPSRLKRIRNWRAVQAAKKPKTDGSTVESAFQGPSSTSSLESLSGVTNSFFPSTSASDSAEMPSLNTIGGPYASCQPLSDQSKACGYEQFSSQPPHSDFTLGKHEHKAAGGSSSKHHQQLGANPAPFARPQKVLTLEKYREKHAAELALQNGRTEEQGADIYAPPSALSSHHHKKRSQTQQAAQPGDGRRDKASSKKSRLPPSLTENGSATSEELKMRIKVSSERHGGADQGGTLPGKDKHKEHSGHRHPKHAHSHPYSLSGNGRGTIDNPTLSLRASSGHDMGSSSSSRKRPHPDGGTHNHHHSVKSSRSSKMAANSSHYSSESSQRMMVDRHGHDGTNGMLTSNGQHTDYKDTFDMLNSLLSAQGMNL